MMPLGDLDGIADVELTPINEVTRTWKTAADWDAARDSMYTEHPADVIQMVPGHDSFEDLSQGDPLPAPWDDNGSGVYADSAQGGSDGSLALTHDDADGVSNQTHEYERTGLSVAPEKIVAVAYWETSGDSGRVPFRLYNENGDPILSCTASNPGFSVFDNYGHATLTCSPSPSYQEWRRWTLTFDWANNQYDVLWEDVTGNTSDITLTGRPFMNSSSEISRVSGGVREDFSTGDDGCSSSTSGGEGYTDEIWGVLNDSWLLTDRKSFTSPVQPDLQNLAYTLNGQEITVTVRGSPGTAGEEEAVQALGGSSGYTLSWNAGHTNFEVRIDLSSTDRQTAASLSRIELVGEP